MNKVNITSLSHIDGMHSLIWYNEKGALFLWYSSQRHSFSLTMRKQQMQTKSPSIKCLMSTLKSIKAMKDSGETDNCHRLEETQEIWWLKETWCPGLNLGAKNDIGKKSSSIWIISIVWFIVLHSNVSFLVFDKWVYLTYVGGTE